jgi:hypothetical protein
LRSHAQTPVECIKMPHQKLGRKSESVTATQHEFVSVGKFLMRGKIFESWEIFTR